jgi:hypothetical protein
MMYNLFNKKIASELEVTPVTTNTDIEVELSSGDNFLQRQMVVRIKEEWKEEWKANSGQTEIQHRVEHILEEEIEGSLKYMSNIDYVELIKRSKQVIQRENIQERAGNCD